MSNSFLDLQDQHQVASFLGVDWKYLGGLLFGSKSEYKYSTFEIPKKNGGVRLIHAPCKKIKDLQLILKRELDSLYPGRHISHGFLRDRSIITNANCHVQRRFVFNIDLEDFFFSIHFGRIKHLFESKPFNFNHTVATIFAQLCCHKNALPQGAPTSPVLSNMIAWKLDAQLLRLAKENSAIVTRYADDITFSFNCSRKRLPRGILSFTEYGVEVGGDLVDIIVNNGFKVNVSKTRLCDRENRQEVTGLTVNRFPNVKRSFTKQLSAMLHAWKKYGYEKANQEYLEKYSGFHFRSNHPKALKNVVWGKLAFLKGIRENTPNGAFVCNNLINTFNGLPGNEREMRLLDIPPGIFKATESLWVVEVCYDQDDDVVCENGTGFSVIGGKIITCSHVISKGDRIYDVIEVFKESQPDQRYKLDVIHNDTHRDLAVCQIKSEQSLPGFDEMPIADSGVVRGENVVLLGYPGGFSAGKKCSVEETRVSSVYVNSGVKYFNIGQHIRPGHSGGPLISAEGKIVGVAHKGIGMFREEEKGSDGNNTCVSIEELKRILS